MAIPYSKPALDHAAQLAQLKARGMVVEDDAAALHWLEHFNYYRLGAYWLPFEANHQHHQFKPGTTFSAVLGLYEFDRQLRLLMLDALARIEVSARAQWAYQLGMRHGAHAHLDPKLAVNRRHWQSNVTKLAEQVERSDEIFIRHLRRTYSEALPPVWAACEVMSLGLLSRWYANLRPKPTRRAIASAYGADDRLLGSWLHHLTHVRNICAHQARLWNRDFTITPQMARTKPPALVSQLVPRSRKLYNTLVIAAYLMDVIEPRNDWGSRMQLLLREYQPPLHMMGFPTGWQQHAAWRGANG